MVRIGIVGKIWLGMAIMIAGFLVIVGLGLGNSFLLGKRLDSVKDDFYPAVVAGTNASTSFKQLLERYNRGVILAEPQIIEESGKSYDAVVKNLLVIGGNAGARPELRTEAKELNVLIQKFSKDAVPLYTRLSQGEEPTGELSPQKLAGYSIRSRDLQARMENLRVTLVNDFNMELSAINQKLQQQQQLNIILFVIISIISGFSAFYVITRQVKDPVQLTVKAANQIADGHYSQRLSISSDDEIGELAGAFNKMAQHLEETLSGLQREVAERTRAQEALQTNEENLRITLDSIGDAVIATDTEGRIVRINPVAAEVTEWDIEDAKGKSFNDVFNIVDSRTREPVKSPVCRILKEGDAVGLATDTTLITRNGVEKQIADSGAPICNAKGEMVGVVVTFRDITEQLAKEAQLQQNRKMDSIGQLAGGIAHDFNNMLAGIVGGAEVLRCRLEGDEETQMIIDIIMSAADNASDLTQKLLSFSRKGKVNAVPMDVHEPIQEAIALLERSIDKRIQVQFEGGAEYSMLTGDRAQLQNAVLNLGINARDALPNGGSITISTANVELDETFCRESSFDLLPGLYLKLSVRDNGIGMSQATQERIFEPFFTTKDVGSGTGLGLAAVYGFVKEHQGGITLHSVLNEGTVFDIYLPVDEELKKSIDAPVGATVSGDGCVLLVDDEDVIRRSLSLQLKGLGYSVIVAVDGRDGVEKFRENMDKVDFVIMDMIMPEMNGPDCFREMRKLKPAVRVIITSGFAQSEDMAHLHEEGVEAFLQKPYTITQLSSILNELSQNSDHS